MNTDHVGVVVIGRNEGERLARCFHAVGKWAAASVYVDSGSTDGSVALARSRAIEAIELDSSAPFSAARARNAGYRRLLERDPHLRYVQFVDGDCELAEGWLEHACEILESQPDVAALGGRLREREPHVSIYNRLAELEWNAGGAGETSAVGGVFMARRAALDAAGGFDPSVPAGEEPELCNRLRLRGWRIVRVDREMASHDLAMHRFGQWWRRMRRFGYGSADVGARFGLARFRRNNLRVRLWGAWLAALVTSIACTVGGMEWAVPAGLTLAGLWCAQTLRIAFRTWREGHPVALATAYAFFLMLSLIPQLAGQLLYAADRTRRAAPRLLEKKTAHGSRS
jgi:GT2 family glycosyltransferase